MEKDQGTDTFKAIAKTLASKDFGDRKLKNLAEYIDTSKYTIEGVNFCPYGICIDMDLGQKVSQDFVADILKAPGYIRKIELFPRGIIAPDRFTARVVHHY